MAKLQGIFTPNIVPLDSRGNINEPELRRYVDWLIERGVHGLYPNGSTGEFTRFTVEERRRIIKIVCEQCGDRAPVLAGAAEANVKETIAACELYHSYGARAVAIVSPFYYKLSPESVYAYFKEIALHSPIDVTLYNIPMFASPIDVPTLRRLSEFERIVGIKDSSGDVAFMGRLINAVRPWPYTPVSLPKKEFMERSKQIWEELELPPLKPRMPWYGYSLGAWTPEDEEEAIKLVPEAVIEVISRGYEAKDLEIGPEFYLSQGVKDVVVFNPYTLVVLHVRRDEAVRHVSPVDLKLLCGCRCTV